MRSMLMLCLLAGVVTGCAGRMTLPEDTTSAAPQMQPGTLTGRINGDYTWYGTVRSRNP